VDVSPRNNLRQALSLTILHYRPARQKVSVLERRNYFRYKGKDPSTNSNLLQGHSLKKNYYT
jgi:hypothetical protein